MVTKTLFHIDRAAEKTNPPVTPIYSPHGYIIQPDGTTWALLKQWTHGFVLALLYPEVAAAYTERALEYPESLDDVDVFAFQAFELDKARELNCVRVCSARMMGPTSVDLPFVGCTPEQKDALRIVLYAALGYSHTDFVSTQHRDMTVRYTMELAELNDEQRLDALYGGGEFRVTKAIINWRFLKLFRPDVSPHSVTQVYEGTRYVLSIGWLTKRAP